MARRRRDDVTFARADGATKQEAEQNALEKATRYLAQTRRFPRAT